IRKRDGSDPKIALPQSTKRPAVDRIGRVGRNRTSRRPSIYHGRSGGRHDCGALQRENTMSSTRFGTPSKGALSDALVTTLTAGAEGQAPPNTPLRLRAAEGPTPWEAARTADDVASASAIGASTRMTGHEGRALVGPEANASNRSPNAITQPSG